MFSLHSDGVDVLLLVDGFSFSLLLFLFGVREITGLEAKADATPSKTQESS
jgi:hypothetical protein